MPHQQLEKRTADFHANIQRSIEKISTPTMQQLVVSGLAAKALSHCEVALSLLEVEASSEAVILLRSAYEAAIKGLYYQQHPQELPRFEAFTALVALRNQLEVVANVGADVKSEDVDEQLELAKRQREKIIQAGYHAIFRLKQEDLKLSKLKSVTSSPNFSFERIRNGLAVSPLTTALRTTGFQVYNLGSQMAHSSFEMISCMVYFQKNHPLLPSRALYRQILLLSQCACTSFATSGVINQSNFDLLIVRSNEDRPELNKIFLPE